MSIINIFEPTTMQKAPVELVELAYYGQLDRMDRQVVILSQLLVDDVNNGYGLVVVKSNLYLSGVHSLRHIIINI
jgi:hypothetical protein